MGALFIVSEVANLRTCVAALTRTIITAAKSTPWGFHKDVSDVVHRMVVVALFFECLADLDNIGGYFNYQLKPRDKAPSPESQRHDTQREESPLFMKQYEDVLDGASESFGEGGESTTNTKAEAHGSEMTADSHALFPPAGHSLQSAAIHRREYDVPQEDEFSEDEVRVLGGSVMGMDEGAETGVVDQNNQVALPTTQAPMPVQSRTRRLVNRTTRDYEALTADFKLLSRTYKTLRRTFARRVVKYRRRELHVCQGNCFHELEEADHRNWEKGQEIDSLKISVSLADMATLRSGVDVSHVRTSKSVHECSIKGLSVCRCCPGSGGRSVLVRAPLIPVLAIVRNGKYLCRPTKGLTCC